MMALPLGASIASMTHLNNQRTASLERTNSNINNAILEKYGITLKEDSYGKTKIDGKKTHSTYPQFLLAENNTGKNVQVRVELSKDKNDVTAFVVNEAPRVAN